MKVLLFKPRFAPRVVAGTKRQTIRPMRVYPIVLGDILSLRMWKKRPYQSKQMILLPPVTCLSAVPIELSLHFGKFYVQVGGSDLSAIDIARLAIADGFRDVSEFELFFFPELKQPDPFRVFNGCLIRW